jgi:hypothetical protein
VFQCQLVEQAGVFQVHGRVGEPEADDGMRDQEHVDRSFLGAADRGGIEVLKREQKARCVLL